MKPIRGNSEEQPIKKLKNEVDGMFQRFFEDPFFASKWLGDKDSMVPACNIIEKQNRYTIEVEIPGVDPDAIDIEVDSHMIKIKGERKHKKETEDAETQMHTIEHSYGSFFRSFTLPDNINVDEISADNKNGILYIDLPKTNESKSRRIQIRKNNE